MVPRKSHFNKKIFALLLDKARGDRTTRQFAADCGISYVQLHKLEMCGQENPPGKKLLKKLAENSVGGIELEDLVFACGADLLEQAKSEPTKKAKTLGIQQLYDNLTSGQQKTVYDFMDYLLNYKK